MPARFTNVLLEKIRTCFSFSYDCEDIVSGAAQRRCNKRDAVRGRSRRMTGAAE
jgi:hypothetical protein